MRTNYKLISELANEIEQIEIGLEALTGETMISTPKGEKDYAVLLQDYNELRNKLDYALGYIPLNNHMLYFLDRDGLDMTEDEYLKVYQNTQMQFNIDKNEEPEIAISLGHTEDSVRNIVDRECIKLDEEKE